MHSTDGRVVAQQRQQLGRRRTMRATSTRAPAANPASDNSEAPMCDAEQPGRKMSSGVSSKPATALAIIQPNVSWVCVTPFGLPVLPDVKKMNTGVSGEGGMIGRVGIAAQELVQARAWAVGIVIMNSTEGQTPARWLLARSASSLGMGDEHGGAADLQSVIDFRRLVEIGVATSPVRMQAR